MIGGVDTGAVLTLEYDTTTKACGGAFAGDWVAGTSNWVGATTLASDCDGAKTAVLSGGKDLAGNVITKTFQFSVDSVVPTLTIGTTVTNCVGTSFTLEGTASDDASGVSGVDVSMDGGTTWSAATTLVGTDWTYNATLAAGINNTFTVRVTDNAGNTKTDTHAVYSGTQLSLTWNGQNVTGGTIYVPNVAGQNSVVVGVAGGTTDYATYKWTLDPATPTVISGTIGQNVTLSATVGVTGTQTLLVQDPVDGGLVFSATTTVRTVEFTATGDAIAIVGDTLVYNTTGATGTVTWSVTEGDTLVTQVSTTDNSATYTADAAGTVKITALDAGTNVSSTVTTVILDPVSVTNKPAETPTVKAGTSSALYKVAGGDLAGYTWTVTGPNGYTYTKTGANFSFVPPATGAFAGTYTVTVKDAGENSQDTFDIFVPIKLVMAQVNAGKNGISSNNLEVVPPVAYEGDTFYLWAQGLADDTGLDVTYVSNPVITGETVLTGTVVTTTMSFFQVQAYKEGTCVVVVQDTTDVFTDSLRVDVLGFGDVSGTITNNQSSVSLADLEVNLFRPADHQLINSDDDVTDGTYSIANVPNGMYIISLEGAGTDYVPFEVEQQLLVSGDTVWNLVVPEVTPLSGTHTLDVIFNGDFNVNNPLNYALADTETGAIVRDGSFPEPSKAIDNDLTLVGLSKGTYTFGVSGGGYVPQDYINLSGTNVLTITTDTVITMTLENEDPSVEVYHQKTSGGVTVYVIETGSGWNPGEFEAECNSTDITSAMTGNGNEYNPYTYAWVPGDTTFDADPVTDANGNDVYTLLFKFYNNDKAGGDLLKTYPVTYTVYASDENRDDDLDDDQKDLEALNGVTVYVTTGGANFLPSVGTTVMVMLPDADGTLYEVPIVIPSIPVSTLFVDDYDTAGYGNDKLDYSKSIADGGTDYYEAAKDTATPLAAGTLLRAVATFYTFGGDAYGTGVSLKFVKAADGTPVRYNPILLNNGKHERVEGAPAITVPILLNKESKVYGKLKKMSDAQKQLGIKVSERGDGKAGFHYESLDFTVMDNGVMYLDLPHLTVVSPAAAAATGGDDDKYYSDDDESDCFVDTVSAGSGFAGLMMAMAALFALLAVKVRRYNA